MTDAAHSLPIWTIYHGASDMPPGIYRVRRCSIHAGGIEHDECFGDYGTLEAARAPLRDRGLYRLDRHPNDPSPIVETWI